MKRITSKLNKKFNKKCYEKYSTYCRAVEIGKTMTREEKKELIFIALFIYIFYSVTTKIVVDYITNCIYYLLGIDAFWCFHLLGFTIVPISILLKFFVRKMIRLK